MAAQDHWVMGFHWEDGDRREAEGGATIGIVFSTLF